jgi:hypothetical protein
MTDHCSIRCFVIKLPISSRGLWEDHGTLAFASSANPSGKGNSGRVEGIESR